MVCGLQIDGVLIPHADPTDTLQHVFDIAGLNIGGPCRGILDLRKISGRQGDSKRFVVDRVASYRHAGDARVVEMRLKLVIGAISRNGEYHSRVVGSSHLDTRQCCETGTGVLVEKESIFEVMELRDVSALDFVDVHQPPPGIVRTGLGDSQVAIAVERARFKQGGVDPVRTLVTDPGGIGIHLVNAERRQDAAMGVVNIGHDELLER